MPNWYNRLQQNNKRDESSWLFSVESRVSVPPNSDEETEKEMAYKVLKTVLDNIEGDASLHTAIDSNVNFDIQFEPMRA
jgi:hypothetical protein